MPFPTEDRRHAPPPLQLPENAYDVWTTRQVVIVGGRGKFRVSAISPPANPRIVLGICVAVGFTTLLDQAIFVLALPHLREGLHASTAQLQLIVAIYSIAFGVALVPAGRLGDILGRRRLLLLGLAMFGGFSLLGGLAHDAPTVIAARLLQGLGAGILNTQVLGLIQDLFHGPERARALGRYLSAGGLAGALGPLLGGLTLALAPPELGWRLLFLANLPFGLLLFPLALRQLPRGRPPQSRLRSLDGGGLALLSSACLGLMSATLVGAGGLPSPRACLGGAALALLLFVAWERRCRRRGGDPILAPGLVGSPGYLLGTAVAMFQFAAGMTLAVVVALFFLDGLHLSPLLYAALSLPGALGMVIASTHSWRFVGRWGRAGVAAAIAAHMSLVALGGAALLWLPGNRIVLIWPLLGLLQGLATGLMYAPNQALTLAAAGDDEGRGVAAGFLQLSQRLAGSIGMAWGTGLFLSGLSPVAGLQAHRAAFGSALVLVLALAATALLAALADSVRRGIGPRPNRLGRDGVTDP